MANQPPGIFVTLPNVKPKVVINGVTIDLEEYFNVSEEQQTILKQKAHEIGLAKHRELHAESDESWRKNVVRVVGEEITRQPAEEVYFSDLMVPQLEAITKAEFLRLYNEYCLKRLFSNNGGNLRKIAGDILKESGNEGRSDRGR
ncbi:MAG: hypothetical protein L6R38_003179 [Xanthoria sp. 2 TBL-2021]|nr:MAG: hypothetical protein L6R38_003179 [Xanthoria sp. 2 TBL-2021]